MLKKFGNVRLAFPGTILDNRYAEGPERDALDVMMRVTALAATEDPANWMTLWEAATERQLHRYHELGPAAYAEAGRAWLAKQGREFVEPVTPKPVVEIEDEFSEQQREELRLKALAEMGEL